MVIIECMNGRTNQANQLFAVLIKLRRGLESLDVSNTLRLHTVEC